MKGGFSYKDLDIADLGLNYAPEMEDTYAYRPAQSNIHEESFDGHHGGYFYGATRQPKEFTLRCFFEEERIDRGIMAKIYSVFKVGSSGKLVFQRRPWCYYHVVITEVTEDFTNYLNGLVTIKAKAYYPFARSDVWYSTRTDKEYADIMSNTAVVERRTMLLPTEVDCSEDITEPTTIFLMNPGTEPAAVGIEIAGDAPSGVYITNKTNGEQCKFVGLTKAATTEEGQYLYSDPINGRTVMKGGTETKVCFLYHDYGFLSLEPAFPAMRDLYVQYNNSNTVTVTNMLYDFAEETAADATVYFADKHIYLNGEWIQIARVVDEHTLELKKRIEANGTERTMAAQLNEIYIAPVADMALTRLKFIYKPTYS